MSSATDKGHRRGTHRLRPPAETVADYARFMRPMGITRLADVTGLDTIGLPVFVAVRPASRALATAQGKGLDADAARASALMESIEGWHAERIDRPLRHESYLGLARAGVAVVDPRTLPRAAGTELHLDEPLAWIEGRDLGSGAAAWLPFDVVTGNFVRRRVGGSPFFVSTNGLASGNHAVEATVHALCEVIERDALALWTRGGGAAQKARHLDLATVADDGCRAILERLARAGVAVAAWDITSDVGVPAYTAAIVDDDAQSRWRVLGSFSGHGCHLDPAVALARALAEAVQSRLTFISGSRDDAGPRDYLEVGNADDQRRLLARFRTPAPMLRFDARGSGAGASLDEDLARILAALAAAGLPQAIAVDLSRPDVGIPVVRVVVPGLEPPPGAAVLPGPRATRVAAGVAARVATGVPAKEGA